MYMYMYMLERKEGRSKAIQTIKAKQHNTPKAVNDDVDVISMPW